MRDRFRRDEGQVLGLALVFLVFVALVLAATLTAAASSLRATQAATQQRDERYAAEAGIFAAAAKIRDDPTRVTRNRQSSITLSLRLRLGLGLRQLDGSARDVHASPRQRCDHRHFEPAAVLGFGVVGHWQRGCHPDQRAEPAIVRNSRIR